MNEDVRPEPSITSHEITMAAGGGAFALPELTIGVFEVDQPSHRISVGSDARQEKPLTAGQGWILPAGADGFCEFDDPLSYLTVSLSGSLLAEVGFESGAEFDPKVGAHDPLILQMVRTVVGFDAASPRLYRETMQRALAAHLTELVRPDVRSFGERSGKTPTRPIDDRRLRRAIAYIRDNLPDDLSLKTLAAEATLSPYHFARTFKKATGLSPLQFVIRERLQLARILLDTTTLTVVDIALRVGYEDVSRFRQHFKRHHGATPIQVRAR